MRMQMQGKNNRNTFITLVTCWYNIKSKFSSNIYVSWIKNFLSIVNNFNLVIYTDSESYKLISKLAKINNNKIRIVFKSFEKFYTYKYKDYWINNHKKSNMLLHKQTDWKLNMLWNEKVFFVEDAFKNKYFDTPFYAWCDIGYFRNNNDDLNTKYLQLWPNTNKLFSEPFSQNVIHYGCVQNDNIKFVSLATKYNNFYKQNKDNILTKEEPNTDYETVCFAGGFFLLQQNLINYYVKIYSEKLEYYFAKEYFIKDDQTIVSDIIFTNPTLFYIHTENNAFNNWFMFQRLLC